VFALFQELDVVVHPSFRDSFGYAVVEAMAAGKPVICIDAGAVAAIVSRGGGRILSCRDFAEATDQMAAILEHWARDAELRRLVGEQGRALAITYYAWSNQRAALQQVYEEVTRAGSARGG
jgi:glycosyltransferase involved in cell wall biosynthesis